MDSRRYKGFPVVYIDRREVAYLNLWINHDATQQA